MSLKDDLVKKKRQKNNLTLQNNARGDWKNIFIKKCMQRVLFNC